MVKIRLSKTGAKKRSSFRIVAIESQNKRNGQILDILGFYDPKTKPPTIKISQKLVDKWLKQGAQLTTAVRKLIKNEKTP
jgi:small subunit ribosomal protein S16